MYSPPLKVTSIGASADMNLLMVSDERVSLHVHVQENQNITSKHTQNTVTRHTL